MKIKREKERETEKKGKKEGKKEAEPSDFLAFNLCVGKIERYETLNHVC